MIRPISLLPLPGKILESLIHQQLSAHLENNKLINDSQNGFRKNKSTTDTTFQLITEILNAQNQGKSTNYGVPQASILGPLLFILYINNMPQALNNSRASLYAVDAAAHCAGSTVAENINTLQDDITKLGIWCR